MLRNSIFKYYSPNFFLGLFFVIYVIGLCLKEIFEFKNGYIDLAVLLSIAISLIAKPEKLISSLLILRREKAFIFLILFTIYFIFLSFKSHNTFNVIFLEYLSLLKWIIYFYLGFLFKLVYKPISLNFPKPYSMLLLSLAILFYSLYEYDWVNINLNLVELWGFRENRITSLFSMSSIFSLFGIVLFVYSINLFRFKKELALFLLFLSLLFIFFSGARKAILGLLLLVFFLKSGGYFRPLINMSKKMFVLVLLMIISITPLFDDAVKEYSNINQPRNYALIMSGVVAYDYFPFGPGPGTLFSGGSIKNYSPVYYDYGIDKKWGFGPYDDRQFYNDTYWAQIIGQFGFIGVLILSLLILFLFKRLKILKNLNPIGFPTIILVILILSVTTPTLQNTELALFIFFPAGMNLSHTKFRLNKNEK